MKWRLTGFDLGCDGVKKKIAGAPVFEEDWGSDFVLDASTPTHAPGRGREGFSSLPLPPRKQERVWAEPTVLT